MDKSAKNIWQEEYNRLKKIMEKLIRPAKDKTTPQLVLQPIPDQHDKKYLRGNLR